MVRVSPTERLDAFQRRHRWAGFPLAVVYKFADDQAGYLAALISYYGFVSLFPLLLLLTSLLGFALQGSPELQRDILDSALSQFPVIGEQLARPGGLQGSGTAVVVGVVGSLYGALGVAQAFQNAMNVLWAVPRHRRPNPVLSRLRSLLLLGTAGLAIIGTTVLSALAASAGAFGWGGGPVARVAAALLAVLLNAAVFMLAFRIGTAHRLRPRQIVPGALLAAVVWQLLQSFGGAYVGHVVKDATATNSVFAVVLGLVAWIYLGAVTVLLAVEVNVVRAKRLWPRALLTPFTDDVQLTRGDRRAYTGYARAQSAKGFETVDVRFDEPPPDRPADR